MDSPKTPVVGEKSRPPLPPSVTWERQQAILPEVMPTHHCPNAWAQTFPQTFQGRGGKSEAAAVPVAAASAATAAPSGSVTGRSVSAGGDWNSSSRMVGRGSENFDEWKRRTDHLAAALLAAERVRREQYPNQSLPTPASPASTAAFPKLSQNAPPLPIAMDPCNNNGSTAKNDGKRPAEPAAEFDNPLSEKDVEAAEEFDNPLSEKEEARDLVSDWELSQSAAVDFTLLQFKVGSPSRKQSAPPPLPPPLRAAATQGGVGASGEPDVDRLRVHAGGIKVTETELVVRQEAICKPLSVVVPALVSDKRQTFRTEFLQYHGMPMRVLAEDEDFSRVHLVEERRAPHFASHAGSGASGGGSSATVSTIPPSPATQALSPKRQSPPRLLTSPTLSPSPQQTRPSPRSCLPTPFSGWLPDPLDESPEEMSAAVFPPECAPFPSRGSPLVQPLVDRGSPFPLPPCGITNGSSASSSVMQGGVTLLGGGCGARAGVGLVFKEKSGGGVLVESVVRGGGASCSSHPPKRGDLLVAVDTQDVRWETLQSLRHLLVGEQGTSVVLEFQDSNGHTYMTQIQRRVPQFHLSKAPAPSNSFSFSPVSQCKTDVKDVIQENQESSFHVAAAHERLEVGSKTRPPARSIRCSRSRSPDRRRRGVGGGYRGGSSDRCVEGSYRARSPDMSYNAPDRGGHAQENGVRSPLTSFEPCWSGSWPPMFAANTKNSGEEVHKMLKDAQARVAGNLYRENMLNEELRDMKERFSLQAAVLQHLQKENAALRRTNAELQRALEHEHALRRQEHGMNVHLRGQIEQHQATLANANLAHEIGKKCCPPDDWKEVLALYTQAQEDGLKAVGEMQHCLEDAVTQVSSMMELVLIPDTAETAEDIANRSEGLENNINQFAKENDPRNRLSLAVGNLKRALEKQRLTYLHERARGNDIEREKRSEDRGSGGLHKTLPHDTAAYLAFNSELPLATVSMMHLQDKHSFQCQLASTIYQQQAVLGQMQQPYTVSALSPDASHHERMHSIGSPGTSRGRRPSRKMPELASGDEEGGEDVDEILQHLFGNRSIKTASPPSSVSSLVLPVTEDVAFTKEDVDMASEIGSWCAHSPVGSFRNVNVCAHSSMGDMGNGFSVQAQNASERGEQSYLSVPAPPTSDGEGGWGGWGGPGSPLSFGDGSSYGAQSSRSKGIAAQAYFDEWSYSLPAREEKTRASQDLAELRRLSDDATRLRQQQESSHEKGNTTFEGAADQHYPSFRRSFSKVENAQEASISHGRASVLNGTNNSCNSSNVAGASGIEVREGVGGLLDGGRLGTDTRAHARIQTHHARKDSGELDVLDVEDGAYY